ncbi:unnamed protein product [Sphagnum balticum]
MSTPLCSFQDLKLSTRDIIAILEDTLNTTSGPLPIPEPHATEVPSNTLERHLIGSRVADDIQNLVTSSSMAKLVGFPSFDSTFTYQKGVQNTSLVDLLLNKGVVDSNSFHKVSHSFPKVVPSERTSIATGVAMVDNTELAIQVGGHTPRVVLLDTGAQPVILRIQFAKKMGMFDSKLRKSMWQIRTASGSVEEVLGESSNLITLKFNEGTDQELCLQVRCLVTNATSYDVLIGQEALFPPGWECQGFSSAGFGEGLSDTRSGLFTDMIRLITWAQSISPTLGYVIENTPFQLDQREKVQEHYTLVKHFLGEPLLLDAAQCGSYMHRLRNWWTNLAPLSVLQLALRYTIRDPNL